MSIPVGVREIQASDNNNVTNGAQGMYIIQ